MPSPLDDELRRLLDGTPIAHVATILPDGSPHSVPVWVGLEEGRVAFLTSPGSRKARNLDRDPRLCISLTENGKPTTMAQIRGRVSERREGDAAFEIVDRISEKYIGGPYPLREDRVVFLVEPDRAWAQAFA
jgi:PPOX class probable F420-dependent enzyme